MKCYKQLFSKKGIKSNLAFISIIPIIIFHLFAIIFFYKKQIYLINKQISDISFSISNWDLVKADKKEKRKLKRLQKRKKRKTSRNKNKTKSGEKNAIKKNNEIKILSLPTEGLNNNGQINKKKRRKKNSILINNLLINDSFKNENINTIERILTDNKEKIEKAKRIMLYNDEEINNFSYKLALEYDKRSFCEYYISLLKTKNIIIFSFYTNTDYNSKIIKIDLFFINFVINYSVNALFFNDDTMHKIYEEQGSFNFIYQLPQIIYSSLISFVLNLLLELLALSEGNILKFKKNKDKSNLTQREKDLNNKLRIKFIFYFIISFILLLFFWYYLSTFGAIYVNTQSHLIKDTLISFGLSLISPFGIHLLPGMFRIPSLSNKKNKRKYLYNLSLVFQMI